MKNSTIDPDRTLTEEEKRLLQARERTADWKRWGPYLSERGWGTVREDYSEDGEAWKYFPHDHARSRAYRWNEDGIAGICDRHQYICFALGFWNGHDPIIKERLFGLTGKQGNHGEDVKEYYFYLDSTPTHSYMKYLYRYPQACYPYEELLVENGRRGRNDREHELIDTGVFDCDRYFDISIEYAKADVEDILVRITVVNHGDQTAPIDILPTIWFRNTWSWGRDDRRPGMKEVEERDRTLIELQHHHYGMRWLHCNGNPDLLFTENDTNNERLFNGPNTSPFVKDGINDYIVDGTKEAVNPQGTGTKGAAHYHLEPGPGESITLELRFSDRKMEGEGREGFGSQFDSVFAARQREAEEFYRAIIPEDISEDARNVMRQSFAGLLWSKQHYHYIVEEWLEGDPAFPPPPATRMNGRNHEWTHLYNEEVISMPDKWEYPWYAAWDLAFHCIPFAMLDPDFAKEQFVLMLREWYMHPSGQLPAYEWAFGDVNPPVHAWGAWQVYTIDKERSGRGDRLFLGRVFHKLLINFTWWVNRKDAESNNIFQGGFLGLDNIGLFNRSAPLPTGGNLEQSDATSWMAMYCLDMMRIALELAEDDPAYEDVASKFWEHFVFIADAMDDRGHTGINMWNEEDGFYYDVIHLPNGTYFPIKVRSMVGLIPLFAVEILEPERLARLGGFTGRLEWFMKHRPDLVCGIDTTEQSALGERHLLSVIDQRQLRRVLQRMLDEEEFLSPYGIRSLSRYHAEHPYELDLNGTEYRIEYEPGESLTGLFGGNSNWRGPVWFPVNFLIVESLRKYHHYLGDDYRVECPTGSGTMMNLDEVANEISRRLGSIFLRDSDGRRAFSGEQEMFQSDPRWRDQILFFEYFHGDSGEGLGASHQTGWTALVATLLQRYAKPAVITQEKSQTRDREAERQEVERSEKGSRV